MEQSLLIIYLIIILTFNFSSIWAQLCPVPRDYSNCAMFKLTTRNELETKSLAQLLQDYCAYLLIQPEVVKTNVPSVIVTAFDNMYMLSKTAEPITIISTNVRWMLESTPKQHTSYSVHYEFFEQRLSEKSTMLTHLNNDPFYQKYHALSILESRWMNISKMFPSKANLSVAGRSVEGRPIYVMRLGRTNPNYPRRILINALVHAREWVVSPVVTYFAERLLKSGDTLLSDVEVLVVPVSNPDGYEYTRFGDRFWRKNRRIEPMLPAYCAGVDLNRNWEVDFAGKYSTSDNPCSVIFSGPRAFSEPETRALKNLVELPGMRGHIDFHAYGSLLLGPYAHSMKAPKNASILDFIGRMIVQTVSSKFGKEHRYSRGAGNELYPASGVMMDYSLYKGVLSFTAEVRPELHSYPGFLLSENEILPTCQEWYDGIHIILQYAAGKFNIEDESGEEALNKPDHSPEFQANNTENYVALSSIEPHDSLQADQTAEFVIPSAPPYDDNLSSTTGNGMTTTKVIIGVIFTASFALLLFLGACICNIYYG